MRFPAHWLQSVITRCLVMSLALPFTASAQTQQDPAAQTQPQSTPSNTAPKPDATQTPAAPPAGAQAPPARPILPVNDGTQQNANPQAPANPDTTPKAPVGTAAAPYEKGIGVAASRPAGAVIAPAKQRRTRTLLIKVGVIVAAAVAVGTVIALSNASPSSPH
jgi:predicted lipid-binding transport protein (Tim44 family)